MPNDSLPTDGKQATVAARRRAAFSRSEMAPSHSTPGTSRARSSSVWGPSPATQSTAPRSRPAKASRSTASPLRGSWRPTKKMTGRSTGHGSAPANRSTSTPLGSTSYVPPNASSAMRRAPSDTAVRTVTWSSKRRAGRRKSWYQRFAPSEYEAWKVPTAGTSAPSSVAWFDPGTSGSCRCSTSGPNTRSASSVRRATALPDAIGATEPLESNRVLGPTVVIPGSGGGPSLGASTRASSPSARRLRARPSTWPCTPPANESE
jgi:hypothetical protein